MTAGLANKEGWLNMKLREMIRKRRQDRAEKRLVRVRTEMNAVIKKAAGLKNDGLLKRLAYSIPGVEYVRIYGAWMAFCDIGLADGYTAYGSDVFNADAIRNAINYACRYIINCERDKVETGLHKNK